MFSSHTLAYVFSTSYVSDKFYARHDASTIDDARAPSGVTARSMANALANERATSDEDESDVIGDLERAPLIGDVDDEGKVTDARDEGDDGLKGVERERASEEDDGRGERARAFAASSEDAIDLTTHGAVVVRIVTGDALEDELDDVVANVSASGDTATASESDVGEDMFTEYLGAKYWGDAFGVRVHVSIWVLVMWGVTYVMSLIFINAVVGADGGGGLLFFAVSVVGLAFIMWFIFALLFSCAFIHEYAHIVVAQYFGGRVDEDKGVVLWPFGALAYLHLDGLTLSQEMLVTIAGPLSHVPQMIFWYLLTYGTPADPEDAGRILTENMVLLNAVMLFWNLVPCYPMDGSRILCCILLLTRRIKVESAAWIVVIVSYIASVTYIILSWRGFNVLDMFSFMNVDWVFGLLCIIATTNVARMLYEGRIRDHPTFSRYEVVYDAYHAFDTQTYPEVFL